MAKKIDISQMTHEEVVAYAEKVKQQARDRVNKYYHNTVKDDPVKYKNYLEKCKRNNETYYDSKQQFIDIDITDSEQERLAQYL